MKEVIHWSSILAQKAFWLYYLRLFQGFDGDRVAACCAFFGVTRAALETTILRDLPHVAARLRGELAQTYGALLLYKLTHVAPEDGLDALGDILRAALPPGLFSAVEQTHILGIERRTWQTQQKRPRLLCTVAHPLWRQVVR
ncbi:MAG: hypothetical protein JXA21_25680 [Anaerolineae bacterium]|nr:hypothetical protein [Anaerolineae bacterium]